MSCDAHFHPEQSVKHPLFFENFLSEFATETEKAIVRHNLDLISKADLSGEVIKTINQAIADGELNSLFSDELLQALDGKFATQDELEKLTEELKQAIEDAKTTGGVTAEEVSNQIAEALAAYKEENPANLIYQYDAVWEPAKPVQTTIGFIEDNEELPQKLTLQQALDRMFYQKDELVSDIFVGLLPKPNAKISLDYLAKLVEMDPVNNVFKAFNAGVEHTFDFEDPNLKYIVIVVPEHYTQLRKMSITSQQFNIEAFEMYSFDDVDENDNEMTYDVYIFKEGISHLNSSIIFNF